METLNEKPKKKTEVFINFEELKLRISCKNYGYKDFVALITKINEAIGK